MSEPFATTHVAELLPAYLTGRIAAGERDAIDRHLAGCAACRAELAEWQQLRAGVSTAPALRELPPINLMAGVTAQIAEDRALLAETSRRDGRWSFLWNVLVSQLKLMRFTIWIAAAVTFGIGMIVALLLANPSASALLLAFIAPLVGAASVAFIYGPDNDPSLELALATPTSPRLVLLGRLTFVYGYDLLLALAATGVLVATRETIDLRPMILLWLGPMFFLSALTLVLTMLFNITTAVATAMTLWTVGLVSLANHRKDASAAEFVDMLSSPVGTQLFIVFGLLLFGIAFFALSDSGRWDRRFRSRWS